ncbi:MAG: CvpA family protein, partial [Limnohabitans sp.]
MDNVSAVDWMLLAVLGLSLLLGLWRGFVTEVLSLVGWVAAFYLSQMYAP